MQMNSNIFFNDSFKQMMQISFRTLKSIKVTDPKIWLFLLNMVLVLIFKNLLVITFVNMSHVVKNEDKTYTCMWCQQKQSMTIIDRQIDD